jgi:predicted DNA-binding transcriptional regulator AlpA
MPRHPIHDDIAPPLDRVIWRQDLQKKLCVTSNTVRRWMKAGKLPQPDVNLSSRTKGWRVSTLRTTHIHLE